MVGQNETSDSITLSRVKIKMSIFYHMNGQLMEKEMKIIISFFIFQEEVELKTNMFDNITSLSNKITNETLQRCHIYQWFSRFSTLA